MNVGDLTGFIGKPPEHKLNVYEWCVFIMLWALMATAAILITGQANLYLSLFDVIITLAFSWYLANVLSRFRIQRDGRTELRGAIEQADRLGRFLRQRARPGDARISMWLAQIEDAHQGHVLSDEDFCRKVDHATKLAFDLELALPSGE